MILDNKKRGLGGPRDYFVSISILPSQVGESGHGLGNLSGLDTKG
jgi:hypothetical protein